MKQNQIIAVEKGVKERAHEFVSKLYQSLGQGDKFNGMSGVYTPIDDEGEKLPQETKIVQANFNAFCKGLSACLKDLWDVTATKEEGNMSARADIVVDGKVVLPNVPVTYLLFLEKQLTDVRTFFTKAPTLDPTEEWVRDESTGLYRSEPVQTVRTKKTQAFVVVEGSGVPEKGVPNQVREVTNDVVVGYWARTKFSGAWSMVETAEAVKRVDKLLRAVKVARETANSVEIAQQHWADPLLEFIFTP